MSKPAVYKLKCAVQNYDWGKVGSESKVAQFAQLSKDFEIQLDKPYAELWMGTHPNGPSVLAEQPSTSLKEKIESNPNELLSSEISKIYKGDLPFLFKVLSVGKSLSIQAHPDKKLGKELFEKFPKIYKDPNHKPEMAVAITEFEALCGFRPLEEIKSFLNEYPELVELVGNEVSSRFLQMINGREVSQLTEDIELNKSALRELFTKVMTTNELIISQQTDKLIKRLNKDSSFAKGSIPEILIRLNDQFPGDVGIFCVLLLNYVKLDPGQAMFLGANEPHAYLFGDVVECMAASDNVVRAGLTPKFKDVSVLVNMLTYRYGSAKSQILAPLPYKNNKLTVLYDPPIEEFSVSMTRFNPLEKKEVFDGISGPSIIIVTDGNGILKVDNLSESLEPGSVFFVGANVSIIIEAVADCNKLDLFRAFCTLK